jgi:uncharacterized membrane protein YeaQ/YmgE (transglycosylase-associated protein family)
MAAMLVLWIVLGAVVGLAIARALTDRSLAPTDAAAAGGLGAFLTGALFALISGRGEWFDPLSTVIAIGGAAAFAFALRAIDRDRRLGRDADTPPRPAR